MLTAQRGSAVACSARGLAVTPDPFGVLARRIFCEENAMDGDGEALMVRSVGELEAAEVAWIQRQHQKQLRAQGLTHKYQRHQGRRERARRVARQQD